MTALNIQALQSELSFGARISGLTRAALDDEAVREELRETFERCGVIVFEGLDNPSSEFQVALSNVFGPLKEHPVKIVSRVDSDTMPGVIELKTSPNLAIVEIDGQPLITWQPWHFDHCYNDELNRAGVLRAITISPEGGLTGFADGIQLYQAISPELRDWFEQRNVIYTLDLLYKHMRFGVPKNFRQLREPVTNILEIARSMPRAIHPAIWQRESGEKVLHVSPWMAVGLEGEETPVGDELLQALCEEIVDKLQPYYHQWRPDQMVVWDNWRMLHKGCGCDPKYERVLHRTTIKGDYGLGYFEQPATGAPVPDVM